MNFGSNKYGEKKFFKLLHYMEPKRKLYSHGLPILLGSFLAYACLGIYYKKMEYDTWMRVYGDFQPVYAPLAGNYHLRYYCQ